MKELKDFDVWDKILVYMHYCIIIIKLDIVHGYKFKKVTFEEFCSGTDSRVSESLIGHYWRFKKEIKL